MYSKGGLLEIRRCLTNILPPFHPHSGDALVEKKLTKDTDLGLLDADLFLPQRDSGYGGEANGVRLGR